MTKQIDWNNYLTEKVIPNTKLLDDVAPKLIQSGRFFRGLFDIDGDKLNYFSSEVMENITTAAVLGADRVINTILNGCEVTDTLIHDDGDCLCISFHLMHVGGTDVEQLVSTPRFRLVITHYNDNKRPIYDEMPIFSGDIDIMESIPNFNEIHQRYVDYIHCGINYININTIIRQFKFTTGLCGIVLPICDGIHIQYTTEKHDVGSH